MLHTSSLEPILRRAGAVMTTRHGRAVAAHYGSAAGEVTVCSRRVGLVSRSDLALVGVHAPAAALARASARIVGGVDVVGAVAPAPGSWWCRTSPTDLLVICRPAVATRVIGQLGIEARRGGELELRDRTEELRAIGIVGREASALLAELGAYGAGGDPRRAAPVAAGEVGGAKVLWVHQSDLSALAVIGQESAGRAWQEIAQRGREFGLSCVGIEAAERFGLMTQNSFPPV